MIWISRHSINPEQETENRKLNTSSQTLSPPFLCGVLSEHTNSLGRGSQGECPGLVCVAPLGQMG